MSSSSQSLLPDSVILKSSDGAFASISPYGAHVLSWVPAGDSERLFLSQKSEFRPGIAVRGGVPLIFPQFAGMGILPKHGFARTQLWELARRSDESAVFWLSDSGETRQIWPHRFLLEYTVSIAGNRLEMGLSVTNIDVLPFTFSAALHTYLRVADVRSAVVGGLGGLEYINSAMGGKQEHMDSEYVSFSSEVDRIFINSPAEILLTEGVRQLAIRAEEFPDAVIWNPGPEKCAGLADMELDGYLQFVCIEAAVIRPKLLNPGAIWRGSQILFG